MDYKTFEKIINEIKEVLDFEDSILSLCCDFNRNNKQGAEAEIFFPDLSTTCISLLNLIFDDKDDWISYYIWELNFGEYYEDGDVTDENGSIIKLKTIRDLYDLLVFNMLN